MRKKERQTTTWTSASLILYSFWKALEFFQKSILLLFFCCYNINVYALIYAFCIGVALVIERKGKMKRKQPFWVRLFSPVRLKTQRIYVAGSHPRVRLAAFNVFVGIGSFLVAFLLGSVLMIPGESNAEDVSVLSNDASLSIALTPEAMNLAVTPTPDGTLASDEMAIQVSTDNTTG